MRGRLNRWGESDEIEPARTAAEIGRKHTGRLKRFSADRAPGIVLLGFALAAVSAWMIWSALGAAPTDTKLALYGVSCGALAGSFLIPYGTLGYYAMKKRTLVARRRRGLPVDIAPEDINNYWVPVYDPAGSDVLSMGALDSAGRRMPLGMTVGRVITVIAVLTFFVAGFMAIFAP